MHVLRRALMIGALGLCSAPAAQAAPVRDTMLPTAQEDATLTALNSEMAAYGLWMTQLNAIQLPVLGQLSALQPAWDSAMRQGPAKGALTFRPIVDRMVVSIDQANRQLAALDQPDFPSLALTDDIKTPGLVADAVHLNGQVKALIQSFIPLMDAMKRNDQKAGAAAGRQMIGSMKLLLAAQEKSARAALAATPREEGAWHMANAELLLAETMALIISPVDLDRPAKVDTVFATRLSAMADKIAMAMDDGDKDADATLERWHAVAAELDRTSQANGASAMQRAIRAITVGREIFATVRSTVPILRDAATRFRTQPVSIFTLGALLKQFRPIRQQANDISVRAAEGMAGV
ncbi:hypothetical protein ACFOKF_11370 [Sphingobium rhizovicinum]|uniref:Uncharacterized protein n=1 Tax=Sphingobium rhizovicinum TaxID=432308 RepID=A0ABV7NF20_9SPHN